MFGQDSSQQQLAEWMGGFFDGDGSIIADVHPVPDQQLDYNIRGRIQIKHTYIGGLFDAEGCMKLNVSYDTRRAVNHKITNKAQIEHRQKDRLVVILNQYADEIGVNSTVVDVPEKDKHSKRFNWRISNRRGIRLFLESIRPYSIIKKPEIEIMLDEILPRLEAGHHSRKRGFLELIAWKDTMDDNKGGDRGKYTLTYFEELWDMELEAEKYPESHPENP